MTATTRQMQRSPTDLFVHYFSGNFDEVAEEMALAMEADGAPTGVQVRQRAAANLRELIRTLIALRANRIQGIEEPLRVAEGLPGLDPAERRLLGERMTQLMASAGNEATDGAVALPAASAEAVTAVLEERLKLAREIHDGLAGDLSQVVGLFKFRDQRAASDPEEAERILDQIRERVEEALREARDILAALRPRQLVRGSLSDALKRLTDDFARINDVTASVTITGGDGWLTAAERDTVYHVLREALANIRRHAHASTVEVCLDLRARPFTLTVDDDGVGLDHQAVARKRGSYGLTGMRERAGLIGGQVEVGLRATGGTRVTLRGGIG